MHEIYDDLFDIVKKIKEINSNYRVFRNVVKHRFEIYCLKGVNLNLEIVVPFDKLDFRTINLLNKTKIENADELFEEIEKNNEKLLGENAL